MPISTSPNSADESIATALFAAFIESGKEKPVLPAGRRDDVIALLTALMADRERLAAYVATLEAAQERLGVRDLLLQHAGLEIPESIALEGFGNLTDDELADFALSPEALEAIAEFLDDLETEEGDWLVNEVMKIGANRPDALERSRRAQEIYQALKGAGLLSINRPDPATSQQTKEPHFRRPLLRWSPTLLAAAASLLIGIAVGALAFRSGWAPPGGELEVLVASASPVLGTSRGGAPPPLYIEVGSDRAGFATVISLAEGRGEQVFPDEGDDVIRVAPNVPVRVGPLPPDSTEVFVLVTETPAAGLMRDVLLGRNFRASERAELSAFLEGRLSELGYRWVAKAVAAVEHAEVR